MAIALKIRILYLIPELLAHTFVVLGLFKPTWAVAALFGKPLLDELYHFFIGIKRYFHMFIPFVPCYFVQLCEPQS